MSERVKTVSVSRLSSNVASFHGQKAVCQFVKMLKIVEGKSNLVTSPKSPLAREQMLTQIKQEMPVAAMPLWVPMEAAVAKVISCSIVLLSK